MDLNFAKEKGGDGVSNAREVRAQRTIRNSARQCDKQGADAHENPGTGLSLNSRAACWAALTGAAGTFGPLWVIRALAGQG